LTLSDANINDEDEFDESDIDSSSFEDDLNVNKLSKMNNHSVNSNSPQYCVVKGGNAVVNQSSKPSSKSNKVNKLGTNIDNMNPSNQNIDDTHSNTNSTLKYPNNNTKMINNKDNTPIDPQTLINMENNKALGILKGC